MAIRAGIFSGKFGFRYLAAYEESQREIQAVLGRKATLREMFFFVTAHVCGGRLSWEEYEQIRDEVLLPRYRAEKEIHERQQAAQAAVARMHEDELREAEKLESAFLRQSEQRQVDFIARTDELIRAHVIEAEGKRRRSVERIKERNRLAYEKRKAQNQKNKEAYRKRKIGMLVVDSELDEKRPIIHSNYFRGYCKMCGAVIRITTRDEWPICNKCAKHFYGNPNPDVPLSEIQYQGPEYHYVNGEGENYHLDQMRDDRDEEEYDEEEDLSYMEAMGLI